MNNRYISIHEQKAKKYSVFKQKWYNIADKKIFARSKWEFYYACYLQVLKDNKEILDWYHEKTTFWFDGIKRGTNNYKPDFLVIHIDESEEYIETKGYETPKDLTKLKRMAKYHPTVKIRMIGKEWFKSNLKKIKIISKKYIDENC